MHGFCVAHDREAPDEGAGHLSKGGRGLSPLFLSAFLDGLCDCYIPVIVEYAVEKNTIFETYTYRIPE